MRTIAVTAIYALIAAGAVFAQQAANTTPVQIGTEEIKDYRGLALRLRSPSDPVSEYIAGVLSKQTLMVLMKYEGTAEPSEQLKAGLLLELNGLLKDQKFFSRDRFKGHQLPDSLLAQSSKPRFRGTQALARFNKRLLQIAFAAEFGKAPRAELKPLEPPTPVLEDTLYTPGNLAIARQLCQRLIKPADNMSKFIRGRLRPSTRDSLKKCDGTSDPAPALVAALAADLNKLLADPKLSDAKQYKDLPLSDKLRKRLEGAKELKGAELARLNKALLDEAYTTGLPPIHVAAKEKPKTPDTTQVRDLKPASSLTTATIAASDLTVANLVLSAPDTAFTAHLWYEGRFSQKSVWRDSFGTGYASSLLGDTVSGLVLDNRLHYDRSWQGPAWGNYQIVNLFQSVGSTKYSGYEQVFDTLTMTYSTVQRDTTVKDNKFDWGLTVGAKRYLSNSPFFLFAENQDSQSLRSSLPDSDKQVDIFIAGGTGYGQVVDLAGYVRAKKYEQALLREGIIAKPLSRAAMAGLIRILQQRKTSQARILEVNRMLTDRGLVVRTSYGYDTVFLLAEILDQSADQLETGLEIRAYYRQQLAAQKSFDRRYLYGFGIGDLKYAKPITLSLSWLTLAHYQGLLYSKDTMVAGLQLYEYGAETGLRYAKTLSEMKASVEILKPFLKSQLKILLHGKYGYKILNKVELEALYDFSIEKDESFTYDYATGKLGYKVRDTVKRSEINLRLKYHFF